MAKEKSLCFAGRGDEDLLHFMLKNFDVNNLRCCGNKVELFIGKHRDDPDGDDIFCIKTKAPIIFKKTCCNILLDSIKEETHRLYNQYISKFVRGGLK